MRSSLRDLASWLVWWERKLARERTENAAHNVALLRRAALAILRERMYRRALETAKRALQGTVDADVALDAIIDALGRDQSHVNDFEAIMDRARERQTARDERRRPAPAADGPIEAVDG